MYPTRKRVNSGPVRPSWDRWIRNWTCWCRCADWIAIRLTCHPILAYSPFLDLRSVCTARLSTQAAATRLTVAPNTFRSSPLSYRLALRLLHRVLHRRSQSASAVNERSTNSNRQCPRLVSECQRRPIRAALVGHVRAEIRPVLYHQVWRKIAASCRPSSVALTQPCI